MKIIWAIALVFSLLGSDRLDAATYPERPVTIVVPFAAGGAVDVMARLIAPKLSESMGQPVVVENRGGGGGLIGMNAVATAKPDGYTVLYSPNSIAINPALYRKLPFDAAKDLIPVSQAITSVLVLVVNPKLKVKTLPELIAKAKAEPGKLNFGSAGVADPLQLGMEMLKVSTGIDIQAIPYKGQGPMFAALLAGEVEMGIVSLSTSLAPIQAGLLHPVAVTDSRRSSALPDVPTISEAGVPGYQLTSWHGFFVPAQTPPDVVSRLHKEIARAVNLPDVRKRIEATGNAAIGSSPAEFGAKFRDDAAIFRKIVEDAKLPMQD